jgi:hypothetical protein
MTKTQQLVHDMYRDESGTPIDLTNSQDSFFAAVAGHQYNRIHSMCFTRWGKSMNVSLACLTRSAIYPEKTAIIAGTKSKSQIIIDYVIKHIFDNEFTSSRFVTEKGETKDEIRRYRNKNRLTFDTGKQVGGKTLLSEIFIGAAKDALGFGADNVIADESALIDDHDWYLVQRMLGDNPSKNFLCKIGNPYRRNHFLKSYHDPAFHKIVIDCYEGLKEGRITQAIIDENRPGIDFKILYECMFPSAAEVSESGWMYLLMDHDLQVAQTRNNTPSGFRRLGVDIARAGRDYNVWVLRTDTTAEILQKSHVADLTQVGDITLNYMKDLHVSEGHTFVDDTGVGGGVTDYLKSLNVKVNAINFGGQAGNPLYANVRSEIYAAQTGVAFWIKTHGALKPHKDWIEITNIQYMKDRRGRIIIRPKDDMRKDGIESPDVSDALALTFAKDKTIRYTGIDPEAVLASGSPTAFGGVQPFYPGMPG